MTQKEIVLKIVAMLEDYYGAKYRESVKHDLIEYLIIKNQNMVVALFEMVKLKEPTRYKVPPDKAVFEAIAIKYENEILWNLQNKKIIMKGLLVTERKLLEDTKEQIGQYEKELVAAEFERLKNKFKIVDNKAKA